MQVATLLLIGLLAAASPAIAGEKAAAPSPTSMYVDISPVAIPIVLKGRLINYIFVTVRLNLGGGADASKLREREPYFRDALVRAAHRTPFVKPGDYIHVDEAALKAAMMAASARLAGPGSVISVDLLNSQPQRVRGLPAPPTATEAHSPIP